VKHFLGSHELNYVNPPSPHGSNSKAEHNHNGKTSKMSDKEKEVLKHRNLTVVTPVVSRIAKNLFKGSLEVAGSNSFNDKDEDVAAEIDNIQSHHSDPESMRWVRKNHNCLHVIMDGVTYSVSILVQIMPNHLCHFSGW
jgi:DNA (cytosine-5)-methyltransferase 1